MMGYQLMYGRCFALGNWTFSRFDAGDLLADSIGEQWLSAQQPTVASNAEGFT